MTSKREDLGGMDMTSLPKSHLAKVKQDVSVCTVYSLRKHTHINRFTHTQALFAVCLVSSKGSLGYISHRILLSNVLFHYPTDYSRSPDIV